jgi:hypothetical protein
MTWMSLLFLFVPLSIWALWIYAFENNTGASQSEKVRVFHSYLPKAVENNTSGVVLISSCIALVFALINLTYKNVDYKAINVIMIIVSSLIIFLTLFSLL